jgi:hypothetical protein
VLVPEVQNENTRAGTQAGPVGEDECVVGTPRLEAKDALRIERIFEHAVAPAEPAVQGKYGGFQ